MKTLLIIYHSQSGLSQQLALQCYQSGLDALAEAPEVRLKMRRAQDADTDDLLQANLVLFIMPENFAAIAGGMKDLLDRVFYPLERANAQGLCYALLIAAGNDGTNCQRQMNKILSGINARAVQDAQIIYNPRDRSHIGENDKRICDELAQAMIFGLDLGLY